MYCCSDLDEKEKPKFSCEGIQRDNDKDNNQKVYNMVFNKHKNKVVNKDFTYNNGIMKSYEHVKKGLSYAYQKHNSLWGWNYYKPNKNLNLNYIIIWMIFLTIDSTNKN